MNNFQLNLIILKIYNYIFVYFLYTRPLHRCHLPTSFGLNLFLNHILLGETSL